jgi:hypothetical protein
MMPLGRGFGSSVKSWLESNYKYEEMFTID